MISFYDSAIFTIEFCCETRKSGSFDMRPHVTLSFDTNSWGQEIMTTTHRVTLTSLQYLMFLNFCIKKVRE